MCNELLGYCLDFFEELEVYEDISNGTTFKKDFVHAVTNFMNADEDNKNNKAIMVYEVFSRAYWMVNNDDSIITMVKEMKFFEEKAGVLTKKQRDHFIHSVNVFLLGISIYIRNTKFQNEFREYMTSGGKYQDYYKTTHEEFLYRWGIASLFHDIAYPIEISLKQLKSYLTFISDKCGLSGNQLEASVFIKNTEVFNLLPKMNPKADYNDEFFRKYPTFREYATNSLSLMALELSNCFGIDFEMIENEMYGYVDKMVEGNQIDHGYYSALIVLRWFYSLVDNQGWNPAYFYFPVVSAVTTIILHNYYKFGLMNHPFNMQTFNVKNHPLGFLLIMCDELQDWDRKPYGSQDLDSIFPSAIKIELEDGKCQLEYLYRESDWDGKQFAEKKIASINKVLRVGSLFEQFDIL